MTDYSTGSDYDHINSSLTTTYTEITYAKPIRGFRIQSRGEANIRHKRRSTDTDYFTIKGGSLVPYTISDMVASSSLGFFATETGTETAEITVYF